MRFAKIMTATTLTSLSGVFLYNAFQGLQTESGNRPADDEQDAIQPEQEQAATSPRKSAISKPEKLTPRNTPKKTTVMVAQPERSPLPFASADTRQQLNQNAAPPETISSRDLIRRLQQNEPSAAVPLSRSDITGHWAESYIEALVSRSVVQGFPDGSFRPDQAVTETEFLTMTQLAFQGNPPSAMTYASLGTALNRVPSRAEAAAFIYRGLLQTEPTPIVTSIQVSGEVVRPGAYSLAALNDVRIARENSRPTVYNAIRQAGGSLTTADLQQIEIHRMGDNGKPKVIRVNLANDQTGDRSQDMLVQQNDRLVIRAVAPTAQQPIESTKLTQPIEPEIQQEIELTGISDPSTDK
ncbi:S-layer homology domain-containing protein [Leptolyngbyaceae cyanobacterium UHCC 1019]